MTWTSEFNVIAQDKCCLGHDCYIAGSALDCKVVHHTIAKITFITIYWLLFNIGLTIYIG